MKALAILFVGLPAGAVIGVGVLWLINKFGLWDWYVGNPRVSVGEAVGPENKD
jgi:hypothetical protein